MIRGRFGRHLRAIEHREAAYRRALEGVGFMPQTIEQRLMADAKWIYRLHDDPKARRDPWGGK